MFQRVLVANRGEIALRLVRALQDAKLTEKDVKLVLLQHPDGKLALDIRNDSLAPLARFEGKPFVDGLRALMAALYGLSFAK